MADGQVLVREGGSEVDGDNEVDGTRGARGGVGVVEGSGCSLM